MKAVIPYYWIIISCFLIVPTNLFTQKDSSFFIQAFDTAQWYRIYLPSDYEADPSKRYPVIYYFHGWLHILTAATVPLPTGTTVV